MMELLKIFSSGNFIAQGHCYPWRPELVWLHTGSDILIALSCYSIFLLLIYYLGHRQDDVCPDRLFLSGLLILYCGTIHLLETWIIWYPAYWVLAVIKGIIALISLYTVGKLVFLREKVLAVTSNMKLERVNLVLKPEIIEYQPTQVRVYEDLKQKIAQLSQQLAETTKKLQAEIQQSQQTKSQLHSAQSQLVQSEKMSSLGMMVAGIAHEINNPVSFVYGNITPAQEIYPRYVGVN